MVQQKIKNTTLGESLESEKQSAKRFLLSNYGAILFFATAGAVLKLPVANKFLPNARQYGEWSFALAAHALISTVPSSYAGLGHLQESRITEKNLQQFFLTHEPQPSDLLPTVTLADLAETRMQLLNADHHGIHQFEGPHKYYRMAHDAMHASVVSPEDNLVIHEDIIVGPYQNLLWGVYAVKGVGHVPFDWQAQEIAEIIGPGKLISSEFKQQFRTAYGYFQARLDEEIQQWPNEKRATLASEIFVQHVQGAEEKILLGNQRVFRGIAAHAISFLQNHGIATDLKEPHIPLHLEHMSQLSADAFCLRSALEHCPHPLPILSIGGEEAFFQMYNTLPAIEIAKVDRKVLPTNIIDQYHLAFDSCCEK